MPRYNFVCLACKKEFSKTLTISEYEKGGIVCPHCKSKDVEQQWAAFYAVTSKKSQKTDPPHRLEAVPWTRLSRDGAVEGLVRIDGRKLTVGATAKLTADIIAGEVIVYGIVKGNVRGKGKVEIKKDGSVNGDLTTAQIIIEDGAFFKGSIEIEKSGKGGRQKRALADGVGIGHSGGGCWAEEYLITKGRMGSYAQERDNKWFAEFGRSHLRSGEAVTCSLLCYAAR